MSRQRDRITRAVESRSHQVASLDWEPVYDGGEMCGLAGGWTLIVSPTPRYPEMFGLNVDELLAHIDYALPPSGPCDCDRSHNPLIAAMLINDPQKPTHAPTCEWHIAYRLRWWRFGTPDGGR